MKKSLKVIASAAMALSMFSSVAMADTAATTSTTTAATKTSKDFKDLAGKDAALLAKIDALLASKVFEGVSTDSFGIDQNMTRAQVAKVLTLIYNVKVDDTVKASSFTDVKADDAANGWAIPYIEAAKKAGLIDGMTDTTFAPGDNVTLGQFATLLVKGLGKKVDVTGEPWYKDAVAQAVSLKILPEGTDGSKLATRADLVGGAFNGQQAFVDANKPAQVSVTSAKATGVKTVTVNFDRDVDTSKATLSLKRGSVAVATTVKFADDKKSATLSLTDTRIMSGDYSVTLGGLDASAIKTASASFTGQDEQVQKIEFVTSSDTIAQANNVQIKLKATNQYGEMASASAGSYNFYGDATKLTKNSDGYLIATVNTSGKAAGVGIATVTVINNDSHVTVTKNFTVGTIPILSKVELGAAQYSNGTAINGTGDNAKFALNFYDQYGSMIGYDTINSTPSWTPTLIWNDYLDGAAYATEDDGNGNPVLKISLTKNIDKSGDFNFTLIDQAASATGKVSIKSAKVATKIQIGSLDDVIAAGDANVYIPVVAYDAQGNQLSADDLVSNDNYNRITINVSGATNPNGARLEQAGQHKGTIHLTGISGTKNGAVSVSAFIATANVTSNDSKNFTIQAARIPDHIKEATAPGKQVAPGGTTAFKYQVIDQYGKVLDTLLDTDDQGNVGSVNHYSVTVTAKTYAPGSTTADNVVANTTVPGVSTGAVSTSTYVLVTDDNDITVTSPARVAKFGTAPTTFQGPSAQPGTGLNDTTYRFAAANVAGGTGYHTDLTVTIWKGATELTKLTRTVTVANPTSDLTYSLNAVPALWNAKDSGVVTDKVYQTVGGVTYTATQANYLTANSKFGREVTISATNAAGETVGLLKQITNISSSDTNIVNTYLNPTTSTFSGKAYVIGNKAGTANVVVSFIAADGTTKTLTTTVTVKNDPLTATNVSWDDNSYVVTGANNSTVPSFNAFDHLDITDSYGRVYEDSYATNGLNSAQGFNPYLGVSFAASNVRGGTVTIDQYGNVYVVGHGVTFDLTATTPSGKSVVTSYTVN